MKKALISTFVLILLVSVTVLFVNARSGVKDKKAKKATTEMSKCCGKSESAASCKMAGETAKACGEAGQCKEMKCEKKDGKCDPATCPKHADAGSTTSMKCCAGKMSEASCPMMKKQSKE